jgi:hypothetical protein
MHLEYVKYKPRWHDTKATSDLSLFSRINTLPLLGFPDNPEPVIRGKG